MFVFNTAFDGEQRVGTRFRPETPNPSRPRNGMHPASSFRRNPGGEVADALELRLRLQWIRICSSEIGRNFARACLSISASGPDAAKTAGCGGWPRNAVRRNSNGRACGASKKV